ncbi:MAG: type II secretion system protein [Ruminococcaceae bacterium]|nr:type II secretion system protein [Oscillospiraceae bacterium]
MRRSNKKGFTTVELVIVIAVIAILAAVLIPTFANLVKKANISADTQLAKNLNTAIAMEGASGDKVDEFKEVLLAARNAGYIISNLNPTTEGCFFVWEKDTNQILLVDGEDGYKVIYANNKDYTPLGSSWYFATADRDAAKQLKATNLNNANVMDIYANAADFSAALAAGGTQTMYMDESVVLDSANILKVDKDGADITIEMGDSTLNTNGTITGIPVSVVVGKLTINGGNIGGSGSFTNENGPSSTAVGLDKAGELVLNGTTVIGDKNGIAGCTNTDGKAKLELNNATVKAGSYAVTVSCGGKGAVGILNNTDTEAAVPIFVSQGGKIVINGGTHVSTGNMSSHDFSNAIFYIQKDQQYGVSSVEITGGTFVCNGKTMTYEQLCAAGEDAWKNLCIFGNCTGVVTIADGKVTISTN